MKNIIRSVLFTQALLTVSVHSQDAVTINPEKPIVGDTVTIVYNPNAPTAKLRSKQLVSLTLLPYARPSVRTAVTFARMYDMQFENNIWLTKLVLTDSTTPFFKYFFSSSIGDSSETDSRDEFQILLHDRNGVPLPNALLCKYFALAAFNHPDIDSLREIELAEEISVHPTNYRAYYVRWSNQLKMSSDRVSTSTLIRQTADSILRIHPDNLDALVGCANVYRELGDTAKAEILEFRLLTLYPLGSDAQILKFRRAFREKDPERRVASLSELLQVFPNSELAGRALSVIEEYYTGKQDSTTPKRIREDWERSRRVDPNRTNPSPEQVKKTLEHNSQAQAPTFVLYDLDGNKISRQTLGNRILVMDFWATWCKPCREAFPHFQRIYEQYRANDRIAFLAVNINVSGDSLANIKSFMRKYRYSFPVALDTSDVTNQFSIAAIPTTIVIDSQGNIRYRTTGYLQPDEYATMLTTVIETLLKN
jgi:thiol-disulfide isomerase/thioredoxin